MSLSLPENSEVIPRYSTTLENLVKANASNLLYHCIALYGDVCCYYDAARCRDSVLEILGFPNDSGGVYSVSKSSEFAPQSKTEDLG